MKFATTEKIPVRYEARPDTWVEHARPESVEVGEIAVYCSGPERPLKKSIYAGIYLHLGSGCYAIELVEGGRADSAFEERVFAERLDYPNARRVLLEKLREMGVDTEPTDRVPNLVFDDDGLPAFGFEP